MTRPTASGGPARERMSRWAPGAIAGLTATAPMTVAMDLLHRRLPAAERHPLPPRQVASRVAGAVGITQRLSEPARRELTLLSHFAYGAAAGALYGPLAARVRLPAPVKGVAFGLALWAASYQGWLPAAGILPPASRESRRRNAVMIAAHVIWGMAAGWLTERLAESASTAFGASGSHESEHGEPGRWTAEVAGA